MKKTILLLGFAIASFGLSAQTVISNGEDIGTGWWQAGSTAVEIVDWHPKTGNPSSKAMTIWISTNSDAWSGGGLSGLNIDVILNNKISVLVYKNVTGTVRLELQDGTSNYFVSANYTTPSEWQKLEFAIPNGIGNITTLLIAPFIDYDLSTIEGEQSRCYWDDVVAYDDTITGVYTPKMEQGLITKTIIYTLNGVKINEFAGDVKDVHNLLYKGVYIVKRINEEGESFISKIAISK
ncbi:hypothetical protein MASR2M117_17800 [Paludibacter sp.]